MKSKASAPAHMPEEHVRLGVDEDERDAVSVIGQLGQPFRRAGAIGRFHPDSADPLLIQAVVDLSVMVMGRSPIAAQGSRSKGPSASTIPSGVSHSSFFPDNPDAVRRFLSSGLQSIWCERPACDQSTTPLAKRAIALSKISARRSQSSFIRS